MKQLSNENLSRRNFNTNLLSSLFAFSLVETLCGNELLAKPIHAIAKDWLVEVEDASQAMRKQKLAQSEWQSKIAEIFARVEPKDLLRAIDFDRLRKKLKLVGTHEAIIEVGTAHRKGLPDELSFDVMIYGMKKGAVIPPHCHRNMTSMHMPIGGALHGWHFDRVADEAEYLIIQPTMDKALTIGEVTTISDEKDNVHWFQPTGEVAYTFNIAVYRIDRAQKFGGRQFYVDAAHGEKVDGDKRRVRKLSSEDAYKIYGNAYVL
jgi:hypothetical protein